MNYATSLFFTAIATLSPRLQKLQSGKAIRAAFKAGAPYSTLEGAITEMWNIRPSIVLANIITGGLGNPSKMPGRAYGFSAAECILGAKLSKLPGTVCSSCYAQKGRYIFENVVACHARRFASLNRKLWIDAMTFLISKQCAKMPFFRWHDSGDIQSVAHLLRIAKVCEATPSVKHWIPTREYKIVSDYISAGYLIPENLQIRLSIHKVDNFRLPEIKGAKVTFSSVSDKKSAPEFAEKCPAPLQDGECGNCRNCWESVLLVDYHIH